MGQSPASDTYNESEGLPFFQGNADFGKEHPEVRVYCNSPIKVAFPNDILISVRAPIGAINIADRKCCIGRGLAAIRTGSGISNRFIYRLLIASKSKLIAQGTGSTFKSIGRSVLAGLSFPVPPLEEQSRIVAELDLLTGIIDKQNAQLKELDNLAQAIFYDMFGDPIENPKGWDISSIKDLAEKYTDGPFGSNLKSEHYQQSGVRIIRLQNIGVNEFVDTDQAFISEEHYKKLEKYTCYPGDIVIGTLGEPNLRACIVPLNIEKAVNKADCVLCRVCKERISEIYLCRVLNNPKFVSAQCQLFSHGQTRARISAGQLKNACIPLPPLALQQSFAEKIQSIEKQKETIRASIADTQKLLDYTMDKYFG